MQQSIVIVLQLGLSPSISAPEVLIGLVRLKWYFYLLCMISALFLRLVPLIQHLDLLLMPLAPLLDVNLVLEVVLLILHCELLLMLLAPPLQVFLLSCVI